MMTTRCMILILAVVALMTDTNLFRLVSGQGPYSCDCQCCIGNGCTAISVGVTYLSDCATCGVAACASAFPSSCAAVGVSGGTSTTCGANTGGYDPTVWLGTYTPTGCDPTSCCCMTSVTISSITTSTSNQYKISGPAKGVCGGGPSPTTTTISATAAPPVMNSFWSYTVGGQLHSDSLSDSGTISDKNNGNSACSATLTKNGAMTVASAPTIGLMVMIATGVLAAMKLN